MKPSFRSACFVLALLSLPMTLSAQQFGRGQRLNMPHSMQDNGGNQWMIYPSGWCQIQGNQPIYSQGAMLMINGQQPNQRGNQARIDEKTGEVLFENMNAGGLVITRRIWLDKENSCLRYIDVLRNPQGAEQSINLNIQSNLNFGIDQGVNINDPRKKDNVIGFTSSNQNG